MATPRVTSHSAQAQKPILSISMLTLWQHALRALLFWHFRKLSLGHELWWLMSVSMPKRGGLVSG
jgi:hypothetical protein